MGRLSVHPLVCMLGGCAVALSVWLVYSYAAEPAADAAADRVAVRTVSPSDTESRGPAPEGTWTPAAETESGVDETILLPNGTHLTQPLEPGYLARLKPLMEAYHRTVAEARARGRILPPPLMVSDLSIQEVHARGYLRSYRQRYALEDAGVTVDAVGAHVDEIMDAVDDAAEVQAPAEPQTPPVLALTRRVQASAEDGTLSVALSLSPADARAAEVLGATLSQKIPLGWEIVEATPAMTAYNDRTRLAKWLVQGSLGSGCECVLTVRPVSARAVREDWNIFPTWAQFLQEDESRTLMIY